MNKISKLFKGLSILIRKPYLINNIVNSSDIFRQKVIKAYNMPEGLPQIDIKTLFPDFKEDVEPFAFLDGGCLPIDIAVLKALAKKYNVKDYLEIGTWRGESVANVAAVVDNCYTLNLPDEDIRRMNMPEAYIQSHRFFSEHLKNVKHIFAHSHTFDFKSLNTRFDMVFVDGDHHYEAVKTDTISAFNILKNNHSIIVWHDYAASPETIRWDVMKGILDGCPPEKRGHIYQVSNTLCAVYIDDELVVKDLKMYALPNKKFKVTIEMKEVTSAYTSTNAQCKK